jgi:hypothetical protein
MFESIRTILEHDAMLAGNDREQVRHLIGGLEKGRPKDYGDGPIFVGAMVILVACMAISALAWHLAIR